MEFPSWEFERNGEWHRFETEVSPQINKAISTRSGDLAVIWNGKRWISLPSNGEWLLYPELDPYSSIRIREASVDDFLPPTAPNMFSVRQNAYKVMHQIPLDALNRHPSRQDSAKTLDNAKIFISNSALPSASIESWLQYFKLEDAKVDFTIEKAKELSHIIYVSREIGLHTDFAEYLFGSILPHLAVHELIELLKSLQEDDFITWKTDECILAYTMSELQKRDPHHHCHSHLPQIGDISLSPHLSMLSPPQSLSLVSNLPPWIDSTDEGRASLLAPLPPQSPRLPQTSINDSTSKAQVLPSTAASPPPSSSLPLSEDSITSLAHSLISATGSALLCDSTTQVIRNGTLAHIVDMVKCELEDLRRVLEKASSMGGRLAQVDEHVIIPDSELCNLWDHTIHLTCTSDYEPVDWEILAPTRADRSVFFTCAHRIKPENLPQSTQHPSFTSNWGLPCDPYVTSGRLRPGETLPLLLSYVPLDLPKIGNQQQPSFTHLICIRLKTSSTFSTVFVAVRAKPPSKRSRDRLVFWRIPPNEVYRGPKLGQGSYGSVYHANIRGLRCSLKYWSPITADFKIELGALSQFRHENLIPFIGAYESPAVMSDFPPPSAQTEEGFVVLKYANGGNLHQYYGRHDFTPSRAFILAYGTACGLQYLHLKGCIHRDIKSLNVLVDDDSACLIDFGSVRRFKDAERSRTKTGSLPWVAPEVMGATPSYTTATDIFSFGIILYELAARRAPPIRDEQLVLKGAVPQLPPDFANDFPDYAQLYRACTRQEPEERCNIYQVVDTLKKLTEDYPVAISKPQPESLLNPNAIQPLENSLFNSLFSSTNSITGPPGSSISAFNTIGSGPSSSFAIRESLNDD